MPRLSLLVLQYSKLNNLSCNSTRGRLFKHFYYMRHFSLMEKHSGPVQLRIQQKLGLEFCPTYLQVVNESYKHSVPPGSESHFKVVIVSDAFEGKSPIQRHRSINTLLGEELSSSVHALSIQAKTPDQWEKSGHSSTNTPPCLGGSKADKR